MSRTKKMKIFIVLVFVVSGAADITCLGVHSPLAPPQREQSQKIENLVGPYHAFYDVDGTVRSCQTYLMSK
jgi:hypothetical protein